MEFLGEVSVSGFVACGLLRFINTKSGFKRQRYVYPHYEPGILFIFYFGHPKTHLVPSFVDRITLFLVLRSGRNTWTLISISTKVVVRYDWSRVPPTPTRTGLVIRTPGICSRGGEGRTHESFGSRSLTNQNDWYVCRGTIIFIRDSLIPPYNVCLGRVFNRLPGFDGVEKRYCLPRWVSTKTFKTGYSGYRLSTLTR